jgi:hypothetical protein
MNIIKQLGTKGTDNPQVKGSAGRLFYNNPHMTPILNRPLTSMHDMRVAKIFHAEAMKMYPDKPGMTDEQRAELAMKRKQHRWSKMNSFLGQIYGREGQPGDSLTLTSTKNKPASGVFTTHGSAGTTPQERRENFALPDSNTAEVEEQRQLLKPQTLLEGQVAPQGKDISEAINSGTNLQPINPLNPHGGLKLKEGGGPPNQIWTEPNLSGGGHQVVTQGGTFTGAIETSEQAEQRKKKLTEVE